MCRCDGVIWMNVFFSAFMYVICVYTPLLHLYSFFVDVFFAPFWNPYFLNANGFAPLKNIPGKVYFVILFVLNWLREYAEHSKTIANTRQQKSFVLYLNLAFLLWFFLVTIFLRVDSIILWKEHLNKTNYINYYQMFFQLFYSEAKYFHTVFFPFVFRRRISSDWWWWWWWRW